MTRRPGCFSSIESDREVAYGHDADVDADACVYSDGDGDVLFPFPLKDLKTANDKCARLQESLKHMNDQLGRREEAHSKTTSELATTKRMLE